MSHEIQTDEKRSSFAVPLPDRAVIVIEGVEAAHFLHTLLTANILALQPSQGTLAALLTPQGKIIADMLVFNVSKGEDARFLLDCAASCVDDLLKRLTLYKLRAKANLTHLMHWNVTVLMGDPAHPADDGDAFTDPRTPALGRRLYGENKAIDKATSAAKSAYLEDYHNRRIAYGVPEAGRDYAPLTLFPHEANLDQLGGVDFKKGCYIGQEVVSRMEHRGLARTRAVVVRSLNGLTLPSGADVIAGESRLGFLGQSEGGSALGFVRLDRVVDALTAGIPLTAGGLELHVSKPDYAQFEANLSKPV